MGTTADKLNKLLETKAAIKNAIIAKGIEVADSDTFASYPAKIEAIEVGGGSDEFLAIRTNNGTDMSHLFYNYQGTNLDISSWNTDNVTDMEYMFYNCCNLKSLDLSNFNTNNVTNIESMFVGCTNLERLDLSNFIINSSLYGILVGCDKLQELRLDNCNNNTISKIINSYGFPTGAILDVTRKIYCKEENVAGLTPPNGWIFVDSDGNEIVPEPEEPEYTVYTPDEYFGSDMTDVYTMVNNTHTSLNSMFCACTNLTTIHHIDKWNTSNVTDMNMMFNCCENLTSLDLSSFDTSNVTDMGEMFSGCTNLTTLDLSNFDTSKVTNMQYMFTGCGKLQELRLDNCTNDTINKIITSSSLPTGAITGVTRKIYCKQENAAGLTPLTNWVFEYIS
jgi:surface protein